MATAKKAMQWVDWGDGIFGAEAAAQAYFGTGAADLTADEAARLAAILPNPHKWKAAHPGRYVRRRAAFASGSAAPRWRGTGWISTFAFASGLT